MRRLLPLQTSLPGFSLRGRITLIDGFGQSPVPRSEAGLRKVGPPPNILAGRQLIAFFSSLLVILLCNPVHAQSTASIEGQVNDQYGAIVPGVEITVVSREIGLRRVAVTDDDGRYQIPALPVGSYRIEVRAPGFQTQIVESSTLEVGRRVTQNFQLQVGDVSQVVTVTDQ